MAPFFFKKITTVSYIIQDISVNSHSNTFLVISILIQFSMYYIEDFHNILAALSVL